MKYRLFAALALATLAPNTKAQSGAQNTAADVVFTIPLALTQLHPDVYALQVWCTTHVLPGVATYFGTSQQQQLYPSNRALTDTAIVTVRTIASPGATITYECYLMGAAHNTGLAEQIRFSTMPQVPQGYLSPTPQASGSFVW
jgi:hypothetical protein